MLSSCQKPENEGKQKLSYNLDTNKCLKHNTFFVILGLKVSVESQGTVLNKKLFWYEQYISLLTPPTIYQHLIMYKFECPIQICF